MFIAELDMSSEFYPFPSMRKKTNPLAAECNKLLDMSMKDKCMLLKNSIINLQKD